MSKSGFKKGRLGIGTDNPRYPLDVVGDIRLTGGFRDASGNDFNFLAINNQDILKTPDIAGITCVNSKVGIFNVNPSEQLDVSGNINFTGSLKQNGVEFGGGVFDGVQYVNGTNLSIYISGDKNSHANADGDGNIAIGKEALYSAVSASSNIAIGASSLKSLTNTGYNNVCIGISAGFATTDGKKNVAIGHRAMNQYTTGDHNIAIGTESLSDNTGGQNNIAIGYEALHDSGAFNNIGLGAYAGMYNSSGNRNVCIGYYSGPKANQTNLNDRLYIDVVSARRGTSSFIYGHMDSTNPILAFNAKVGIGKDSPGEHLDVSGNINFTGTLKQNGTVFGGGKFEDAATSGHIYYNGGNVGIGTTSPDDKLHVQGGSIHIYCNSSGTGGDAEQGSQAGNANIFMDCNNYTSGAKNGIIWKSKYNFGNNYTKINAGIYYQPEGNYFRGGLSFYTNGTENETTDATEKMRIDKDGNVGIGTTSPNTNLHIRNNTDTTGTGDAFITGLTSNSSNRKPTECLRLQGYYNSSGSGALIRFTNYHASGSNPSNDEYNLAGIAGYDVKGDWGGGLCFYTAGSTIDGGDLTTRMVIDNVGNVGIGTTSPGYKLEIKQGKIYLNNSNTWSDTEAANTKIYLGDTNFGVGSGHFTGDGAGEYTTLWSYNGAGRGIRFCATGNGGNKFSDFTTHMTIQGNTGNVGIGTTTPGYKLHIVNPTLNNSIQDLLCLETHANSQTTIGPAILFRERWNNGSYWNLARILAMEQAGYGGQLAFFTNLGNTGADDTLLERMRIDENGNVGIGTTDPTAGLDVFSNGSVLTNTAYKTKSWAQMKTEIESQGGSMATRDQILSLQSSILLSGQDKWAPGVTRLGGGEAYKQWYQIGNSNHVYGREHPNYPSWGDGTVSHNFRDTAAIVSKPLKINHGFFINHYEHSAAWGQAVFQMVAASTNYCTMGFAKGTDSGSNDNVLEAISFTRNGKVGINNSDKLYHSLNITGQGNLWDKSPAILFVDDHYTKNWYVGTANNVAEGDFYIRIKSTWDSNPSATGIKLTYAGKLYISSSVHASSSVGSSDDRIKHNEKPITNAMDIINKLTTKKYFKSTELHEANYDYTLDESGNPITTDTYMTEIGFVAQEVEKIPELNFCVEGEPTYIDNMTGEEKPQVLGLSYTNIFSLNVAATQELHKENQALKKEVNELKTIVHALKNHLGLA